MTKISTESKKEKRNCKWKKSVEMKTHSGEVRLTDGSRNGVIAVTANEFAFCFVWHNLRRSNHSLNSDFVT